MDTCLNFESLIWQGFLSGHKDLSLKKIPNLSGIAHILWSVASKVISHHWGDSKDSSDTGRHQTAGALGINSDKLPSKKYFSSFMQLIHKSHTATMVFLLRSVYPWWILF